MRNIGQIQYLSEEAVTNLDHAFISSQLDYGNALLFGIGDTDIQKLQKVQNTAACIVTKFWKYDHITPVLQNPHCLTVKK